MSVISNVQIQVNILFAVVVVQFFALLYVHKYDIPEAKQKKNSAKVAQDTKAGAGADVARLTAVAP